MRILFWLKNVYFQESVRLFYNLIERIKSDPLYEENDLVCQSQSPELHDYEMPEVFLVPKLFCSE